MGPKGNNKGGKKHTQIQPSGWLPKDRKVIERWLRKRLARLGSGDLKEKTLKLFKMHPPQFDLNEKTNLPHITDEMMKSMMFHKPVQALYEAIVTDPEINMFFHQMFWQQFCNPNIWPKDTEMKIPKNFPFEIPDNFPILVPFWQIFILLLDDIMTYTPPFSDSELVGFPINALINWPMATTAGFACFLNDKVNYHFKTILNYWGEFLLSPDSCSVLNEGEGGWFSTPALKKMTGDYNNPRQAYIDMFQCNPDDPSGHWGYTSWDDFFTRLFIDGQRPVPSPPVAADIVNACESAPFAIEEGVNSRSLFWIKKQPYSLAHMLNNDGWAEYFNGGTVYQAFLSATSYHRWHSPISGTIVDFENIDGSYYSQTYNIQDDTGSPNMSQGYISQVAARATIYIMADNPDIGILGFVSIGMSEVSSNEVTVKKGQHVNKGDELGMFHFGGSTHCILYRPQLKVEFFLGKKPDGTDNTPGLNSVNIPLSSKLATITLKPR